MKNIQEIENLILDGKLNKLTNNDIEVFLDEHWLEYTCRNNLSPCGNLTLKGRLEYFQNNIEEIQNLIREFPFQPKENPEK